ncbi:hypothetical protein MMC28_010908 [Mycoblastus sanguinarius]|nr:hypothetical protein [Mycoblastus sanguinarius]
MQYTSVIILGFLNAFALAAPLAKNQIRSPLPSDAAAAVTHAETTADNAITSGFSAGKAGLDSAIASANAAIAEYTGKRQITRSAEEAAANAVADGESTMDVDIW